MQHLESGKSASQAESAGSIPVTGSSQKWYLTSRVPVQTTIPQSATVAKTVAKRSIVEHGLQPRSEGRSVAARAALVTLFLSALLACATPAHADGLLCPGSAHCRPAALHPSPVAEPGGAHLVGRIDTALTDETRARSIMVSAWYPASGRQAPASYVPAIEPAAQAEIAGRSADWLHTPSAALDMIGAQAAATEGAAVDGDRLPVVVLSPGMGTPRWILSGLAADLASRGFAVVAIDHTGESPAVQFPDGRIVLGDEPTMTDDYMRAQLATRTADMRLVLDRLAVLPIVGARLDLERIAALGHSYGGTTAVQLAASDSRIRAVVSVDGPAGWDRVAAAPTMDRPVLLLDLTGIWTRSWNAFRDARFESVAVHGAGHYSAADLCQLGATGADLCGSLSADHAATVTRGVVGAWLDHQLRGMETPRFTAPVITWRT
ncbi:alpha/beta fold hydrolase [Micromonospora sp. NPDC005367]|uniref:alpha/beta hydrolase family protein n=1 Tax=Micromonospora sp. NPDC005367 TaxID=3155590 RepID=UPI0033A2C216